MKVITLHTVHAIQSLNYNNTFNRAHNTIVYSAGANGFIIDSKVFIPMHCIREIVIDPNELEVSEADEPVVKSRAKHADASARLK